MENLRLLSLENLFFDLPPLRKLKQNINSSISLFLIVINLNRIPRDFLDIINLLKTQTFGIHKLAKVIVINEDKNLVFIIFKILVSILKDLNNS